MGGLVITSVLLSEIECFDFLVSEDVTLNDECIYGYLVEEVAVVPVVLVEDEADVGAFKLEVESLLFAFLERGLGVVVGSDVAQLAVLGAAAQLYEYFHQFGDFVLMEKEVEFAGADGEEELNGDCLGVLAVDARLPTFFAYRQVASRVARVLARDAVYPVLELAHPISNITITAPYSPD